MGFAQIMFGQVALHEQWVMRNGVNTPPHNFESF
jgi:hypothetical protein